jgi:type IV pilus assembly protein PilY1
MNRPFLIKTLRALVQAGLGVSVSTVAALGFAQSVTDYSAVPPLLAESATPMVMLAMSNDHQLFYKAYTDFDDLDGDGLADTTYNNEIEYVGYFDSYKCYSYDTAKQVFIPKSVTADKYCNAAINSPWSGNFLNWATMTRIDEVRKVLYGGLRVADSASETILERSFLPNDAHSFAKYYNETDLGRLTPFGNLTSGVSSENSGITICNTTRQVGQVLSQNSSAPPLARVVKGNYALWAANERWQCMYDSEQNANNGNNFDVTGIRAKSSNPKTSDRAVQADGTTVPDYVVRVSACVAGLIGQEDCKQYPNGNYKPIGILQRFGDNQSVMFGLLTGSYKKNKSGGVLRKNIGFVTDEVNTNTDGTFKGVPASGGIINTIDKLRIVNYRFANNKSYGNDDGTYNSADNCGWGKNSFSDGSCTNWGNPFSEILLECYRYFAGKQSNSQFDANDSTILPGLTRQTTWKNPQTADTACASLNVIAFNASTVSYDGDQLGGVSDLNTNKSAKQLTKAVGDGEGITGQYYFVGENGGTGDADKNQLCTAKKVTDLGLVEGTCPDAPRLDGTYHAAGIAHHANTTDLRTDIPDKQTVTTYGVTLAPALPNVSLVAPNGKRVSILPACRNATISGNCGLVDFKVVEQNVTTTKSTGKFYVNWEDSEQGGDYDQDMAGVLTYELTSTKLTITTDVYVMSTPYKMGFGFIVAGTTNDGFHSISGVEGDPNTAGHGGYSGYGCNGCRVGDSAATKVFELGSSTVDSSIVSLLEQPLYYAAKWGGFVDIDGDGKPNLDREWDQRNNSTGASGADGQPDNYFYAINPNQLKSQLTNILVSILDRTASGTSAAVVANTGTGEGAIYQALYNPRFSAANGVDAVDWVGTLNALFIDSNGFIREDNASPKGQLTAADNVVDIFYNPVSQKTQVQRYVASADGTRGAALGAPVDVMDIKPIWSAREELGKVTDYVTQRVNYTDKANTGRYILTGIDRNGDGQIGMGAEDETFDFVPSVFSDNGADQYYRLLGLKSTNASEAENIVKYIRGEDIPGYRNRRIDVDGDGTLDPVLLGDIVNSSPISVGRPSNGYDLAFGDDTYREFRQKYQNRRQMVYVGANDGMLHAFNGGFYNASNLTYELSMAGETKHPLGAELWSYIPYNVLPHLQWLTMPNYPHVFYVDGAVKSFDVNIFPSDATHPGGWGTILVVGLRFGGGEFRLDPEHDADGDPSNDITLRSSYVILDITDPEQPPKVLAEITHPDMGYTIAEPALIKRRAANPTTGSYRKGDLQANDWYLVFGSGPAGSTAAGREKALTSAVSDKTAKLFVYDLVDKTLNVKDLGEEKSFVGGIQSVDWTRDYIDDAIYFGLVSGDVDNAKGKLMRGVVQHSAGTMSLDTSALMDEATQPFSATPLTVRDRLGDYWIYSGTGRFYVVEDNFTTAQQSYYGIKEPKTNGYVNNTVVKKEDLINTTDIRVFTDGSIDSKANPGATISLKGLTESAETFADVFEAVQQNDGWYFDFERTRSRNVTQAVVADQSLVFTEYQPSGLKCQPEGYGFLNAPHLQAGIPGTFAPLGTVAGSVNGDGADEVKLSEGLGLGSPSSPAIHQRGDGKKIAVVQTSTGELSTNVIESGATQGSRESWRELIIEW